MLASAPRARAQAPLAAPTADAATTVVRRTDPRRSVAAGRVERHVLRSAVYGRERRVFVYTPPGYQPFAHRPYALVVAFDADVYLDTIPLPLVLDTLYAAGRLPPFVALLVADSSGAARLDDLANHARFAEFLGNELIPWLRRGWNVTSDPARTIVTGSSAGGLAAANVALARPDLFGNVWSQSGALWRGNEGSNGPPYEWLTDRYREAPRHPIRFALDVGALETRGTVGGTGPSILEANRRFRDALVAKGYDVTYTEVPGGQHWEGTWAPRLPVGLVALAGGWPR